MVKASSKATAKNPPGSVTFPTVVHLGGKTATGIEVPEDVVQKLSGKKRIAVHVTINDYTYRSMLAPYRGSFFIPLSAENRTPAGVAAGDEIMVTLQPDNEPRTVEIPTELEAALNSKKGAADIFNALSVSKRKEHVRQVNDAKTSETRARRIEKVLASL